jgi:hypothetical protein
LIAVSLMRDFIYNQLHTLFGLRHMRFKSPAPVFLLATILSGYGLAPALQAAPQFPQPAFPVGSEPWDVVSADFNHDGMADFAVANVGVNSKEISILLGRGDETFETERRYTTDDGPQAIVVADFNADGNADLAVANIRAGNVSILLGAGDGTFTADTQILVGSSPVGIVAADWNNDSVVDLAVANRSSADLSILLGRGDGTFRPEMRYGAASNPADIVTGDFNGDGIPDVALTIDGEGFTGLAVRLGFGDGSFGSEIRTLVSTHLGDLAGGDLNADRIPDLAVVDYGFPDNISIFLGRGDGRFQPRVQYPVPDSANDVALADLDGDGILDVAALSGTSMAGLSIQLGRGDGSFRPVKSFVAGAQVRHLALADVDGDGRLDVALTNQGSGLMVVLRGTGGGDFGPQERFGTGPAPASVAVGDLDMDGHADLVIADSGTPNDPAPDHVSVLLGVGDGSFRPQTLYPVSDAPSRVLIADLNEDGKKDVATANLNDISILPGRGDGSFGSQTAYPAGAWPISIAAGDLNGDGHLDLAVGNGSNAHTVTLLFGVGDGSFNLSGAIQTAGFPASVAIVDVTGDGLVDILVSSLGLAAVEIHRSLGGGAFGPSEFVATGFSAGMIVHDLNGDGLPDLAGADPNTNVVCAVLGTGAAGFTHSRCSPSAGRPVEVAVGDFDGDGREDLVALSHGLFSSTTLVALHAGDGFGGFQPPTRFLAGSTSTWVAAADFDENGFLDLAISSRVLSEVWLLRNRQCTAVLYHRDADGDGYGDPASAIQSCNQPAGYVVDGSDCTDSNGTVWSPPSEARDLLLNDSTLLQWSPPATPGAQTIGYDVVRSTAKNDFQGAAVCVASDLPGTNAADSELPPLGTSFFYLVRAVDACPMGDGILGTDSNGVAIVGRSCP